MIGRCPCATLSLPPAASSIFPVHRISQLKISVRLKLKPNEHDKSPSVDFQFAIVVQLESSVPRARSPLGVFHGRPPFDRQPARLFRPWPATARPRALGSRRYSEGPAGLERCWWCQPGRDTGKRPSWPRAVVVAKNGYAARPEPAQAGTPVWPKEGASTRKSEVEGPGRSAGVPVGLAQYQAPAESHKPGLRVGRFSAESK